MKNNLYLVSTQNLEAYVVAENTESAKSAFEDWLRINNYGYLADREVTNIKLIAKEGVSPKDNMVNTMDMLLLVDLTNKDDLPLQKGTN